VGRPVVVSEVVGGRGRQVEHARQEARHLTAADDAIRAVQRGAAADRDAFGVEPVDVGLEGRPDDVGERAGGGLGRRWVGIAGHGRNEGEDRQGRGGSDRTPPTRAHGWSS
jgi:hypothetical protein